MVAEEGVPGNGSGHLGVCVFMPPIHMGVLCVVHMCVYMHASVCQGGI